MATRRVTVRLRRHCPRLPLLSAQQKHSSYSAKQIRAQEDSRTTAPPQHRAHASTGESGSSWHHDAEVPAGYCAGCCVTLVQRTALVQHMAATRRTAPCPAQHNTAQRRWLCPARHAACCARTHAHMCLSSKCPAWCSNKRRTSCSHGIDSSSWWCSTKAPHTLFR